MIKLNRTQTREIKDLLYIGYRSFEIKAIREKCYKYFKLLDKSK